MLIEKQILSKGENPDILDSWQSQGMSRASILVYKTGIPYDSSYRRICVPFLSPFVVAAELL